MQSLNLGLLNGDASLEGVVLGIVYSKEEESEERQDLKVRRTYEGHQRTACVAKAVGEVEKRRFMDGVMDGVDGGKVIFLVYSVD